MTGPFSPSPPRRSAAGAELPCRDAQAGEFSRVIFAEGQVATRSSSEEPPIPVEMLSVAI